MIQVENALKSSRTMKAVTGLSPEEFHKLLPQFELLLQEVPSLERPEPMLFRSRSPGGGHKHTLATSQDKLFFILFYLKCYPTFDLLGVLYGVHRTRPNKWVKALLPILEKTLQRELVLPKRMLEKKDPFFSLHPELKAIFLDGTERPIQRPQDKKQQEENYSGKKKVHTKKNIILTDAEKQVLFLSGTTGGRTHDYKQLKEWGIVKAIPRRICMWLDLGFQGIEKDYPGKKVSIPVKRKKGKNLTKAERELNRLTASLRVLVENAIAGIKRLRALTDKYRNHRERMDDLICLLSCGLWNFHLKCAHLAKFSLF